MNYRKIGILLIVLAVLIGGYALAQERGFTPGLGQPDAGTHESRGSVEAGSIVSSEETSTRPIEPSRLIIPSIGTDTHVQYVGVTDDGLMDVPSNFTDVGWYKLGAKPGEMGSAVLAGHQSRAGNKWAVFIDLEDIQVGDSVYVEGKSGETLHFKVRSKKMYPYDLKGPELERVFSDTSGKYLNLITCAGSWVESIGTNDTRLVVYTELIE